jgi:antitoxin component YwqK of YwqJK toxin-antitoxin module
VSVLKLIYFQLILFMKSFLFSAVLLLVSTLLFSQTPISRKIYLDSLWNETDEINHKYYRIVKDYFLKQDQYLFQDYYKSGKLQMIVNSTDKDHLHKEGQAIYYFENGNKKKISFYKKGMLTSKEFCWYENGKLSSMKTYLETNTKGDIQYKIDSFWDKQEHQTVTDGDGFVKDFEVSENCFFNGSVHNGGKNGTWTGYNKIQGITYKEEYVDGKFISGVSTDSNNIEHEYKEILSKPKPKKGMDDFYRHIGRTFNTPKIEGLKGKVYITFVVDANGKIIEPKTLADIGYGTGEEAIRVITNYGDWIPGKERGINVRVLYSIPISIQSRY